MDGMPTVGPTCTAKAFPASSPSKLVTGTTSAIGSPIPIKLPDGSEIVRAKFTPLETVALKPNLALNNGAEFMDLALMV